MNKPFNMITDNIISWCLIWSYNLGFILDYSVADLHSVDPILSYGSLLMKQDYLNQNCPTHSPKFKCGEWPFKCGECLSNAVNECYFPEIWQMARLIRHICVERKNIVEYRWLKSIYFRFYYDVCNFKKKLRRVQLQYASKWNYKFQIIKRTHFKILNPSFYECVLDDVRCVTQ